MAITVNTNVAALVAQRHLTSATDMLNQSMERLSSGKRINSAKDDAAGLQISNRLQSQMRGLDVAVRNANDGISIMQTAEGAMNEVTNIMQRMRDLSLQSANGSNSKAERTALQEEVTALNDELNRIAETTSFGGRKLLNGSFGKSAFQIGAASGEAVQVELKSMRSDGIDMGGFSYIANGRANSDWQVKDGANELSMSFTNRFGETETIQINAKAGDDIEELATYINGQTDKVTASVNEDGQLQLFMAGEETSGTLSFSGDLASELGLQLKGYDAVDNIDITSVGGAQQAVAVLDTAMKYVDSHRAELGAYQNRFNHAINNLDNIHENLAASNSRIQDTDYAKETTQMVKQQILQQVSTSILAQAKQAPNLALTLLG
ncbi:MULTISPECIES: flagellin [Vibrio]|uniref:flagellin n=1 Tax=Vibrio TaxID=662 RepID=UPI000154515C|nr:MULTISPECIES: flagellin [Vibrio]EDL68499.1 flagellin [Vibrio campbellii HY01]MCC8252265.1 flagellin [Vibrio campbellii CAIM 333]OPH55409.1 flagellin [Vibrio campbellii]CAD7803502.1 Flagellin is the subunit protein which polymerizes to form the filaments of bacterial flagella [Vibrio sp. B1FIG11]CAE6894866.1 Flagellin is the subunit protein which polymerizes to form the filaments of bacterial flagella [Vibrio sp. B1FIG11]